MNPLSANPAVASFTFFFQSQHCSDRTVTVPENAVTSSTSGASADALSFHVVAKRAIGSVRSRR